MALVTVKRIFSFLIIMMFLTSCATDRGLIQAPSENQNSRVKLIVIHHTTIDFAESLEVLTKPSEGPVSAHYLIPEPGDPSYPKKKLQTYQLVPDIRRAWHAGASYWRGKTGLNDQSIGIELVYKTYCSTLEPSSADDPFNENERLCLYPDFAESQFELLVDLLRDLMERHPGIEPFDIVGHSDIAPSRKTDPGPRFPWQRLYKLGFGAWYDEDTVLKYWQRFKVNPLPLKNIQIGLAAYGYDIEATGVLDRQTRQVLRAFQMHFVPSRVSLEPDLETTAVLFALIEKYHYAALDCLLLVAERSSNNEGI